MHFTVAHQPFRGHFIPMTTQHSQSSSSPAHGTATVEPSAVTAVPHQPSMTYDATMIKISEVPVMLLQQITKASSAPPLKGEHHSCVLMFTQQKKWRSISVTFRARRWFFLIVCFHCLGENWQLGRQPCNGTKRKHLAFHECLWAQSADF